MPLDQPELSSRYDDDKNLSSSRFGTTICLNDINRFIFPRSIKRRKLDAEIPPRYAQASLILNACGSISVFVFIAYFLLIIFLHKKSRAFPAQLDFLLGDFYRFDLIKVSETF